MAIRRKNVNNDPDHDRKVKEILEASRKVSEAEDRGEDATALRAEVRRLKEKHGLAEEIGPEEYPPDE